MFKNTPCEFSFSSVEWSCWYLKFALFRWSLFHFFKEFSMDHQSNDFVEPIHIRWWQVNRHTTRRCYQGFFSQYLYLFSLFQPTWLVTLSSAWYLSRFYNSISKHFWLLDADFIIAFPSTWRKTSSPPSNSKLCTLFWNMALDPE